MVNVIWPINKLDQDFASAKEPVWNFFLYRPIQSCARYRGHSITFTDEHVRTIPISNRTSLDLPITKSNKNTLKTSVVKTRNWATTDGESLQRYITSCQCVTHSILPYSLLQSKLSEMFHYCTQHNIIAQSNVFKI